MKSIRLNAFIARTGLCSRRKADTLISTGKIELNGRTVTALGTKIDPEKDRVSHCGKQLILKEQHTYILLNKPRGYITTTRDERGRKTVLDLLPAELRKKRLFPIGRLDRDTTGLLILTDDGELANKLTHPRGGIKKTYEVRLNQPFQHEHINKLTAGIQDGGDLLRAHTAKMLRSEKLEIVLTEGKKREIKRMLLKLGYGAIAIKRTKYAFLTLKGLKKGMYKALTDKEITQLKTL
jgi:23S rRNA pseudouridine2605 synthase